jgi:hypothetical protein
MPASRSAPPTTAATAAVAGAVDNRASPACRSATLPTGGAGSGAADADESGGAAADVEEVAGARSGPAAGLGDELWPEDGARTAAPASSLPNRPAWSAPTSAPDPLAPSWPDPDPPNPASSPDPTSPDPPDPRPELDPDPPDPASSPEPVSPDPDPPDPASSPEPTSPDPDPLDSADSDSDPTDLRPSPDPDPLSRNAWGVGLSTEVGLGAARAGTAPAARARRAVMVREARVREVRRVRTGMVLSEWCCVRLCHRGRVGFVTVTRWTSLSS